MQPILKLTSKILRIYHFLITQKKNNSCDLSCTSFSIPPLSEPVILWYSIPNFIRPSPQKNVDFRLNLSYHTTIPGAPQKRRTPCCISLLQQGGFHTTGILQTHRNKWIHRTWQVLKSSEKYTIVLKSTTYYTMIHQKSALGARCWEFESPPLGPK